MGKNTTSEGCAGCVYCGIVAQMPCCNYLLATGKRRPCPPGNECTVKTTAKQLRQQRRQKQYERVQEELTAKKNREKPVLTLTCPICGLEFQTTDSRRRTCSGECARKAKRKSEQAYKARKREEKKHGNLLL